MWALPFVPPQGLRPPPVWLPPVPPLPTNAALSPDATHRPHSLGCAAPPSPVHPGWAVRGGWPPAGVGVCKGLTISSPPRTSIASPRLLAPLFLSLPGPTLGKCPRPARWTLPYLTLSPKPSTGEHESNETLVLYEDLVTDCP